MGTSLDEERTTNESVHLSLGARPCSVDMGRESSSLLARTTTKGKHGCVNTVWLIKLV